MYISSYLLLYYVKNKNSSIKTKRIFLKILLLFAKEYIFLVTVFPYNFEYLNNTYMHSVIHTYVHIYIVSTYNIYVVEYIKIYKHI